MTSDDSRPPVLTPVDGGPGTPGRDLDGFVPGPIDGGPDPVDTGPRVDFGEACAPRGVDVSCLRRLAPADEPFVLPVSIGGLDECHCAESIAMQR